MSMQSGDHIFIWQMIWINIYEFKQNQTINPNNGGKNTALIVYIHVALHYQTIGQGTRYYATSFFSYSAHVL